MAIIQRIGASKTESYQMKKALLPYMFTVSGLALTTLSYAESYQFELFGVYSQSVSDGSDEFLGYPYSYDLTVKNTSYSIVAYLKPVSLEKGPYAEAVFLDKASGVSAGYTKSSYEFDANYSGPYSFLSGSNTFNNKHYSVDGRYVNKRGIIVESGYGKFESDDDNNYYLGLGTYISDASSLSLRHTIYEYESNDDSTITSITFHSVYPFADTSSLSLDAEINYIDDDSSGEDTVGSRQYYFNHSFAIGLSLGYIDIGDDDASYGEIMSEYFFLPKALLNYDTPLILTITNKKQLQ